MKNRADGIVRLNLSVDQAAASLGVSPRTVRTLIVSRELPVVRIRRRVLISLETLAEWNRRRSGQVRE
jgi:excisionase family DNA binding protein